MTSGNALLGSFVPLATPLHRLALVYKASFIFLLALLLAITHHWLVGVCTLCLVLVLGAIARIPLSHWWISVKSLGFLLLILGVYYAASGQLASGSDVLLTLITMVFASRVLLWCTPMPVIADGFIWLCSPLHLVGGSPEKIGLALALMVRSIPVLLDNWQALTTAASARGIKVGSFRLFIPLVVSAVSYAQETGDALAARGLDS
ncbi:MAG: energy-coupling factor transporter transmembrane protein EcfT [Rothia sp. (in: high G+C Gram-positive bacteria)]|nr:energy-coupling factor transporter transmembrane protein EcfT [Rothia sp. (in: high G+C Gram-positive bacteria)]